MPHTRRIRSLPLVAGWLGASLLVSTPLAAQIQASQKGTVSQTISGTDVELEYHRPSARGRAPIFGGIVPWDLVWTPGANSATTLRVSKDVTLNGVSIPAGRYGLWMQVKEAEPWTLLVHADTLRHHASHPEMEEGLYRIPVQPVEAPGFVETLTFTFDSVRTASAELRFQWGNVRVPMDLRVDPGIRLTLASDEAADLAGEWLFDDTPSIPSREEVEERIARVAERNPDNVAGVRAWYDHVFATERPRAIRFEWDREAGTITVVDPADEARANSQETEGGDAESTWSQLLLPRGEGVYTLGYAMDGELAEYDPRWAPLLEFEVDEAGRPFRFTWRSGDDEVIGHGVKR